MLLLIAAIECQEDRDFMTKFYNNKLKLLYHEAGKFISRKEDIEDVVYDAFQKIIENIDVFKTLQPKQQDKYAAVTVRNVCYHHLRKENLLSTVSFDEIIGVADVTRDNEPERLTEQKLFSEQLRNIFSQLDIEDQMLLEKKYILKWTDAEIAQMHGIKSQSIRMSLTRAKRHLITLMGEHGFRLEDWIF